jgi:antirestriction protein
MEDIRIYVASLSDYNDGRLEGKWLDLSDYSDASELMEAIQEMLDELTEKYNDGEVREEWAVHDYEGIPASMASEYMGEQDFQQIYDIAEVADESGVPFEVLIERAGDTGSDDYKALAESLMFVVDGRNEGDIVREWEDQIGELGSDFWSNHIYIDDVTERVIYGEDVDRFRDDILSENPDMDEDEAEAEAERMADAEAEMREDLPSYLDEMGYGDTIPDFVSKDYEGAWERSMRYDYDVINHDGQMYVFSNNYSVGGTILSGMIGAYIGYKVGRSKPQKKGFSTEKRIGRNIKKSLSKKKMATGGKFNQSWHQDHYRHNKGESYEVPVAKRKSKFAGGGKAKGVEWMKSDGQYEAELGELYLIISPATERGLYQVRVKKGYRGETIGESTSEISGLDKAKDVAYDIAGDYYKQYAKGGMTEHGLKVGDEIMGYTKDVNELHVVNRKNNDEWHSVDLDDGKRYAGGGGVDYPNHYLEVEDLNRKINALTQQIESDYRNDEIDSYTDRNERELDKLKQKREFLMYGKDSYSQGGGISGLNDLIRG